MNSQEYIQGVTSFIDLLKKTSDFDLVKSDHYKLIPLKLWQKVTALESTNQEEEEGIIKLTFFDGALFRYEKSISMYLTLQELL